MDKAVFLIFSIVLSALPDTRAKTYHTFAGSKTSRKTDPLRKFPDGEIPTNHHEYTWELFIPKPRKTGGETGIPVYERSSLGKLSRVGTVPSGVEFKFTNFIVYNRSHLYKIPVPNGFKISRTVTKNNEQPKYVWVNGMYIKATSYSGK